MSISISHLSKQYGSQTVLHDVSLHLAPGEVAGFLGPNGAGKTTTMRILAGATPYDTGSVQVCGLEVKDHRLEANALIGYLPEQNPLYPDMYVREYLLFVADTYHLGKRRRQRVDELTDLVGLAPERGKKIGQLSKGYRQRVGLAQALMPDPRVLILDEPTTGLDPNQLEDIRALQRGEAELPDTLHCRLQTLSLERDDVASAMSTCQAIWEAGTTYDTLDGEAYLNRAAWTKAPVLDAPPRIYCPWRRYLARMLDAQLCVLMLFALGTLGFHWNIMDGGRLGSFILSFLGLGLMLLLEPLMLHCFGTTPGKAILGLRVERLDGGRLTYSEAQSRTGQALWRGMGWNLPVLNWIRLYRSYVAHGREGEMSWDRESDFHVEAKPGAWWRNGLYVAAWAAILALIFVFSVMAGFLPHYDQLTPAEYAENYNFLAEFYGDPRYHLDEAGQWDVPNPLAVSYTDIWAYNTPVVEFETDDGSVTALRAQWDFAGESWGARWPDDVMAAMTMAFAIGDLCPLAESH